MRAIQRCSWILTLIGIGAGHEAPTTPVSLVSERAEALTVPLKSADPAQLVPSDAVPRNVSLPEIVVA